MSNGDPAKLTVADIVAAPTDRSDRTKVYLELELKQAELDRSLILNRELGENITHRGTWGNRVFWMLIGWLLSVLAVVLLQGFDFCNFHLDDSVVIAFISTTTVNVLSLGYIVANYLFPKPK
jgi:hypothetical protein